MKTCTFINLDSATERRASVEASFARAHTEGWTLRRMSAVTAGEARAIPGSLKETERACFASHRAALAAALEDDDHVMVVEDDAVFSPQAFTVIDGLLDAFPKWDMIYLDLAIGDFGTLAIMAARRDAMVAEGRYHILDLANVSHTATTAYVVRGSAKRKVHAELSAANELVAPIDVYLRDLSLAGRIEAGGVFPFLTSVSPLGSVSQIQDTGHEAFGASMDAFRRLIFVARDDEAIRAEIGRLSARSANETMNLMGPILANLVIASTK